MLLLIFKKKIESWEESQVQEFQTSKTFLDLYCGSHCQVYTKAYNAESKEKTSEAIVGKTCGSCFPISSSILYIFPGVNEIFSIL